MLKKILSFLLIINFLFINFPAFAKGKAKPTQKMLIGNIEKKEGKIEEVILIMPEEEVINFIGSNKADDVLKNIEELKFSENKIIDRQERLKKATSFMLLGGLSVSGSVQNSIQRGYADNRLSKNFSNPIRSVKDGYKADDNMFIINYVGHPLEWFLLASYLKSAGASDKEAIIISQLTNLTWEFIVEGCYVPPSPKDLTTNALGSLAAVYLYKKGLNKHTEKIYFKLADIGDKYGIDIVPQIRYNSESRGMIFGTTIKIKK